MEKEETDVRLVFLEIVGRKFFNLLRQVGDASLISRWDEICDSTFNTEELENLIDLGKQEIKQPSICNTGVKTAAGFHHANGSSATWNANQMQPIEIIVDENSIDFELDNQPSTSSSIISSQADTQQDAKIYSRIGELRNAGLWSATRLPICVEPPRIKLHWDFLLEEVLWMSSDFRQERRIKRRLARKLSSEARHQWKKKIQSKNVEYIEREKEREAKKVCTSISRMIKEFWLNVDKVVDFRTKEILNSQKRKALDQHLTFLVGEADKLSTILHKRLVNNEDDLQLSHVQKPVSSRSSTSLNNDEDDFEAMSSDEDDETTIANEERSQNKFVVETEINELSKEADMEFDDFLSTLPKEYLEQLALASNLEKNGKTASSNLVGEKELLDTMSSDVKENKDVSNIIKSPDRITDDVITADNYDLNVNYDKLNSNSSEVRRQELNNIAEVALEFQPKGFTLETTQVKTEIPFLLRGKLREYQLVGLDWLVTLYEKNLNGILADEMGLGKTIQTVALLAHLACEKMIWGPHLIIVPTSVILNWEMEFKKWCPALKILTYFGNAKERAEKRKGWSKENAFHVCVTSYKIASQDIKAFKMKAWQYMVLDEAQNIKNFKSQRWQTLLNVRSLRRLLLTGTPLQNSLMELWSLLHFLMPSVFSSHDDFKNWFSNPMTNMVEGNIEVDNVLVQRLHKVLRPFILRRLKSEVETQLPTKQEKVIPCALSKRQRFLYNEFLSRKSTRENLQSGNVMGVLNVIMQLRKCCNHPNLFESRPVISPLVIPPFHLNFPALFYIDETKDYEKCYETDLRLSSSTLRFNAVSSLYDWQFFEKIYDLSISDSSSIRVEQLPKLKGLKFCPKPNNETTFLQSASQFMLISQPVHNGIVKSAVDFKSNDVEHLTTKNGRKRHASVLLNYDDSANKQFNSKRMCRFQNILSDFQRKRQEENRLIGQWLSKIHYLKGAPSFSQETIAIVQKYFKLPHAFVYPTSVSGGPFDTACQMISCGISDWIYNSTKSFVLYVNKIYCDGPFFSVKLKPYDRYNQVLCEQVLQKKIPKPSPVTDVVSVGHLLQFPELRLIEYDCGKLQVLSKLLVQLYENKHRCLIFTQMSKMLDILQAFLSYHNYKYFRLDGSTHIDQRQAMMEKFNNDNNIFCFILSTRSGGVGVNLTGADTVIFYDSDWNPTMDAQAQDRCHRIGQTRNVTIYRLISEKTIEENILKKAMQKRQLGEMALDDAEFTPEFFRNTDNIRDLFNNEESIKRIVAPLSTNIQGLNDIEAAMAKTEDQQDVIATHKAQAEAIVDMAEFDDNSVHQFNSSNQTQKVNSKNANKYLREIESPSDHYLELISGLTPVERYAVGFLEEEYGPELEEEVNEAKALIVAKKDDYLKNSDGGIVLDEIDVDGKETMEFVENDTYDDDLIKEVFSLDFCIDSIPTWMPPSPPNSEIDDENFFFDESKFFFNLFDESSALYESSFISESKLPPLPTPTVVSISQLSASSARQFNRLQKIQCRSSNDRGHELSSEDAMLPSTISASSIYSNINSECSNKHNLKFQKHLRRQLTHGNDQQQLLKKSRRYADGQDYISISETNVDSNTSLAARRGGVVQPGVILSPPESLPSTPSAADLSMDSELTGDSRLTGTTSIYDSAMISALNNGNSETSGANLVKLSDGNFPQKFDESIERVRRNGIKKHLTNYINSSGPWEYRQAILYYSDPSPSFLNASPFLRLINDSSHCMNGFIIPDLAGEASDYEGMNWCCEEDRHLLTAVISETKLTLKMLNEQRTLDLNWHFVANYINAQSKQYRSPKQCFSRYWNLYLRTSGVLNDNQPSRLNKQNVYLRTAKNSGNTPKSNDNTFNSSSVRQQESNLYAVYFDETERIRQITIDYQQRANAIQNAVQARKQNYYSAVAGIQQRAAAFSLTMKSTSHSLPVSGAAINENRSNMIIQILRNAQSKNRQASIRGN